VLLMVWVKVALEDLDPNTGMVPGGLINRGHANDHYLTFFYAIRKISQNKLWDVHCPQELSSSSPFCPG
jgi:hypothetical protein